MLLARDVRVSAIERLQGDKNIDAFILKDAIEKLNFSQKQQFDKDPNISVGELISERSRFMDQLLALIWKQNEFKGMATVIAVGGHGREELFPFSDIDFMILSDAQSSKSKSKIRSFVQLMWDSGLKIGLSVRTIEDCYLEAKNDISVLTSLLEARFICGNWETYQKYQQLMASDILPKEEFFLKKMSEYQTRHEKYGDIVYSIEPNVKESPGGLRDVHTVVWIARYCLSVVNLREFYEAGYLLSKDFSRLQQAYQWLSKIRFALHLMRSRDENRLLLENQVLLSERFGFKKQGKRDAVEKFMTSYYRSVQSIGNICDQALSSVEESLFSKNILHPIEINRRFQRLGDVVDITSENVFKRYPFAFFEIFLLMQNNEYLKKISVRTIRQMSEDIELIDESFRLDWKNRALFMEILRQKTGVNRALKTMYALGILNAYIPAFAKIQGLMQFDLFHVYTVDAHSLVVVRNIRRFFLEKHKEEHLVAHQISQTIAKPELLILSGLLHDIAKGRGGDHAELGAIEAEQFCLEHIMEEKDIHLVVWLVRHHLILSNTAQKKDITNPQVISDFSKTIPQVEYLDYLYLLTVADICGTSPSLYNNYKDGLLKHLWRASRTFINEQRPLLKPEMAEQHAKAMKAKVRLVLRDRGVVAETIQRFMERWDDSYFYSQNVNQVIDQAVFILQNQEDMGISVIANQTFQTMELIVWCKRNKFQFATIVSCLDRHDYSVNKAQVQRDKENHVFYSFFIQPLVDSRESIIEKSDLMIVELRQNLRRLNEEGKADIQIKKRTQDRRIKSLPISTKIIFEAQANHCFSMSLTTRNEPGLLAKIGRLLSDLNILVVGAYISTSGGQVEDRFLLLDAENKNIELERQNKIKAFF